MNHQEEVESSVEVLSMEPLYFPQHEIYNNCYYEELLDVQEPFDNNDLSSKKLSLSKRELISKQGKLIEDETQQYSEDCYEKLATFYNKVVLGKMDNDENLEKYEEAYFKSVEHIGPRPSYVELLRSMISNKAKNLLSSQTN